MLQPAHICCTSASHFANLRPIHTASDLTNASSVVIHAFTLGIHVEEQRVWRTQSSHKIWWMWMKIKRLLVSVSGTD